MRLPDCSNRPPEALIPIHSAHSDGLCYLNLTSRLRGVFTMWLTQTYLAEPATDFPAYAYFLFNPYSDWDGEVIRSIRNGLRILWKA